MRTACGTSRTKNITADSADLQKYLDIPVGTHLNGPKDGGVAATPNLTRPQSFNFPDGAGQ